MYDVSGLDVAKSDNFFLGGFENSPGKSTRGTVQGNYLRYCKRCNYEKRHEKLMTQDTSKYKFKIRKSLFMSYRVCEQQGTYRMANPDDGYGDLNTTNPNLLRGQIFHHAMEDFYNTIDMFKLEKLSKVEDIHSYLKTLLPTVQQPELKKWFAWYAMYEAERYMEFKQVHKLDYFLPYKSEYAVEAIIDNILRTGHFDRIDRISDNELQIIEYKTGKSYDPTNSVKLSNINSELEWYRSIIVNMPEFKQFNIVSYKLINPTLEIVFEKKFNILTKYAVNKMLLNIENIRSGKKKPIKKIGYICDWCEFKDECLGSGDANAPLFGTLSNDL